MIKCSKCKELKDIEKFNFRNKEKNIKQSSCKDCQSLIRRQSYEKNKSYYLEYEKINSPRRRKNNRIFITAYKANKPCKDCGIIYPHYVMDFDHLPEFKKEIKIASKGNYFSKEKLLNEFSKCDLVCANCHRERTWKRKNGG